MTTEQTKELQAKQIARDTQYAEVVKDQEIAALRAENARLREALHAIEMTHMGKPSSISQRTLSFARAVLAQKGAQ